MELYYASDLVRASPPIDHHHTPPSLQQKPCSIRGCHRVFAAEPTLKMCDECRSKHRGYATTKRRKRNLEKAALQVGVAGALGRDEQDPAERGPVLGIHGTRVSAPPGSPVRLIDEGSSAWNAEDPVPAGHISALGIHELRDRSSQVRECDSRQGSPVAGEGSTWNTQRSWDPTAESVLYKPTRVPSSSSELANALTLPTELYPFEETREITSPECISPAILQGSDASIPAPANDPAEPPRYCSVKGCKAVIPGSYGYKMCPSCRTRYRGYGITKRAKWKSEREAFECEMAQLRAAEDERREASGLPSLADNPAELRAWEMSVIDEQITLPPQILAALNAAGISADGTATGSIVPNILSLYQHDPNIDTDPLRSAPPPSFSLSTSAPIPPLPARMCTVSHCHHILPGYYRFKRCEQHRLQNRHHSKLKRVREKEEKAGGPKEGVVVVDIPAETAETGRKAKGKAMESEGSKTPLRKGKKGTHCATEGCGKLLPKEKRWKTCQDCRRPKTADKVSKKDNTVGTHTDDTAAPDANAAAQALRLVNMTPDTFESPAPFVDPSKPSTSQKPLLIRQYKPKGDEEPSGRRADSSQPYLLVEPFLLNVVPEGDAAMVSQHTPVLEQNSYADTRVFRHYVVPSEDTGSGSGPGPVPNSPSPVDPALPAEKETDNGPAHYPPPPSTSAARKPTKSKPKTNTPAPTPTTESVPVPASIPFPYPYSHYPLHPYYYPPIQYAYPPLSHAAPGEPDSQSAPPHLVQPVAYAPFPHLQYPYGPPSSVIGVPPYFYPPPYPYSVSAPPLISPSSLRGRGSSASAPVSGSSPTSPATTMTTTTRSRKPSSRKNVGFNYYHPGYGTTDSPDAPEGSDKPGRKKRRKVDAAWLEKMRLLRVEQERSGSAAEVASNNVLEDVAPVPVPAVGEHDSEIDRGCAGETSLSRILSTSPPVPPPELDEDLLSIAQWTPCSNKTCKKRVVRASSAFCDKCKTRFRKHAERNKRRHNLVPVRLVPATRTVRESAQS